MKTRFRGWTLLVAACAAILAAAPAARGQEPIKVKIARLAFPSLTTMMVDVVKDQGLDRKNGIDLEPHSFGAVSAYYAALATGEVDITPTGPHVLQKMRNEGVPIKAVLTYARLNNGSRVLDLADLRQYIYEQMGRIRTNAHVTAALYGNSKGHGQDISKRNGHNGQVHP